MKVIENKFNMREQNKQEEPIIITCDFCDSIFEISEDDIVYRDFGCGTVICPCCKKIVELDEYYMDLTIDNLEFPLHFAHTSEEDGAVDMPNEKILEYIKEGIAYFRNHKNEFAWTTACGDLCITIFKYDGDKVYDIIVTKDYYETNLDFKDIDYIEIPEKDTGYYHSVDNMTGGSKENGLYIGSCLKF